MTKRYTSNRPKGSVQVDIRLRRARGMVMLLDWLNGKSQNQIARERHTTQPTVHKLMKTAAETLIDEAHEEVLTRVVKKSIGVYEQYLDMLSRRLEAGQDIDIQAIERLMKGMFIFDSPQLKDVQMAKHRAQLEPEEEDSLARLMSARRHSLPPTIIEVPVNESQAPVRAEGGIRPVEDIPGDERQGEARRVDQGGGEDNRSDRVEPVVRPERTEEETR